MTFCGLAKTSHRRVYLDCAEPSKTKQSRDGLCFYEKPFLQICLG